MLNFSDWADTGRQKCAGILRASTGLIYSSKVALKSDVSANGSIQVRWRDANLIVLWQDVLDAEGRIVLM